ncbi:hypothetical protein QEZ40_005089 [Streptomyces katrae]|uniref:Uncharacterized protein n=1 Tax=Streptomyces katrae TaxID=68223 RepID=A0ABT7H196_9ACTN|nr:MULTISPECIES: hypothetical protein [Streptomyces]MDK9499660.1 hypothetical protein [Streptomyces katrae]RST01849.1 hypothetical protein EF910_26285 [Streptomyces sp. WAC07149]
MRARKLGLALATAILAGTGIGATGAVSAHAATAPTITRDECTAAGGQVTTIPYGGTVCTLPDGTRQTIT